MKRHGNLWPQVIAFDNLWRAARQAQRGKRWRPNVLEFNFNLENELVQLHRELSTQSYQPGAYRTFHIVEPKRRMISAAPYRDRVVHHALCNVIAPLFERTFIDDNYANRTGYGTHRALRRFTRFARSSRYVLQGESSARSCEAGDRIRKSTEPGRAGRPWCEGQFRLSVIFSLTFLLIDSLSNH